MIQSCVKLLTLLSKTRVCEPKHSRPFLLPMAWPKLLYSAILLAYTACLILIVIADVWFYAKLLATLVLLFGACNVYRQYLFQSSVHSIGYDGDGFFLVNISDEKMDIQLNSHGSLASWFLVVLAIDITAVNNGVSIGVRRRYLVLPNGVMAVADYKKLCRSLI
ncbi:MAG: hypothetical protein ACI93R_000692 [Flavobacteriales bacterium]|jgi:hypothetical protein